MTLAVPDHKSIRQSEDRSWTLPLLEIFLKSSADDHLDDVIKTLTVLDDYRILVPLTRVMEDVDAPTYLRAGASEILSECTTSENATTRRNWWNSHDPILMRHAILVAERSEMDIVERIASDPQHEFYLEAIETLSFGFEEQRFQQLKIKALYDSRADIRTSAARAILWDQPIEAEDRLLQIAQEADEDAARGALNALAYYESQTTLSSIYEQIQAGPETRRDQCQTVFEFHRDTVLGALIELEIRSTNAAAIFKKWLAPIWDLLAFTDEELSTKRVTCESRNAPGEKSQKLKPDVIAILNYFDNADGLWCERWKYMSSMDWTHSSSKDSLTLIKYFSQHPDWSAREVGCSALAKLDATDALLELLQDKVFAVRKSAAYCLRDVHRQNRVAERLWALLQDEHISGTHATEALESYIAHSTEADLDDRLCKLAQLDRRESIKATAIWQLKKRASRHHIQSLIPLLDEKPLITWAAHQYLLSACVDLRLPVSQLESLMQIDDFSLQETVAEFLAMHRKNTI